MHDQADEFERLRIRDVGHRAEPPAPGPGGNPAFLGRVTSTGAALGPGKFVLVKPVTILGTESEGGPASLTVATQSVPVYILAGTPATGDDLVVTWSDHRWVTSKSGYVGPAGNPMSNCNCTSAPFVIAMDSSAPLCNSGTSGVPYFPSCTIRWVSTPSAYAALNLGASCYLSDQTFADQNGDHFRFYLKCVNIQFQLYRVYATSQFGSPLLDGPRFTWQIGNAGNTCTPFLMSSGVIYAGGNPSCNGTITLSPSA